MYDIFNQKSERKEGKEGRKREGKRVEGTGK